MDKILSMIGLVRKSTVRDLTIEPYSDEEIDALSIDVSNKRAIGFDKDKQEQMIDMLRKNPYFAQFLDWTINEDVKRAFNVTDAERPIVRGAVSRTRYIRSLCFNPEEGKKDMRNKITRYAK